jgi:hypothetical protein
MAGVIARRFSGRLPFVRPARSEQSPHVAQRESGAGNGLPSAPTLRRARPSVGRLRTDRPLNQARAPGHRAAVIASRRPTPANGRGRPSGNHRCAAPRSCAVAGWGRRPASRRQMPRLPRPASECRRWCRRSITRSNRRCRCRQSQDRRWHTGRSRTSRAARSAGTSRPDTACSQAFDGISNAGHDGTRISAPGTGAGRRRGPYAAFTSRADNQNHCPALL